MDPRPDASPEALQVTRACFHVAQTGGSHRVLVFVPPGGDLTRDGLTMSPSVPAGAIEATVDRFAAVLAPLVDLGIARGHAQRHGILALGSPASRSRTPPVPPEAQTSEVAPIVEDDDDGADA